LGEAVVGLGSAPECRFSRAATFPAEVKTHVRQALVCSIVAFAATVCVAFAALGPPSTDRAGEAVGRLLALTATAGIASGWIAARATPKWSWFKFVIVYAAICVALLVITAYGRNARAGERQAEASSSLSIAWPSGWIVQHLAGASSDPADHDLGSRERGLLGDPAAPSAVIEIGCVRIDKAVHLADEFTQIYRGAVDGYRRQGLAVTDARAAPTRIGVHEGLGAVLHAKRDAVELIQNYSLAQSSTCLLVATLTARREAFSANLDAYAAVKASVR